MGEFACDFFRFPLTFYRRDESNKVLVIERFIEGWEGGRIGFFLLPQRRVLAGFVHGETVKVDMVDGAGEGIFDLDEGWGVSWTTRVGSGVGEGGVGWEEGSGVGWEEGKGVAWEEGMGVGWGEGVVVGWVEGTGDAVGFRVKSRAWVRVGVLGFVGDVGFLIFYFRWELGDFKGIRRGPLSGD